MLSRGLKLGLVGLVVGMTLVGCSGNKHKPGSYGSKHKQSTYGAATQGIGEETQFSGQDQWGRSHAELMADRTYHFGFDRFDVNGDDMASIEAHGEYLSNHPNKTVRVEGHTDERGSREYNVALGERRAKAVETILLTNGASPSQINIVSYGSEKPEIRESNDYAFAQNRRAIIVYEE